jgi:hypothetical protein
MNEYAIYLNVNELAEDNDELADSPEQAIDQWMASNPNRTFRLITAQNVDDPENDTLIKSWEDIKGG